MDWSTVVPRGGRLVFDHRQDGRALRVHWHEDEEFCSLSIWRENVCVGTFHLGKDHVLDLIEALTGVEESEDPE